MNIAVIAANGKSGTCFVETALKAGHRVSAGVYTSNPFVAHPNLTVAKCDARDPDEVAALVSGNDVVVSLIGHSKSSPARIQSDAIKVILACMEAENITHLISLTGTGVRFPGDQPSFIDKILNLIIARIDSQRVQDGIEHAHIISRSQADWTILRVLKLTSFKPRKFSLSLTGPAKILTSRYEVAQAILTITNNRTYIKKAPIISR